MLFADRGNETGEPGGPRVSHGVDRGRDAECQNFDTQSVSTKRKPALWSRGSNTLVGCRGADDMELACEDSVRVSMEIENPRSQLDEDVKELGYCEENEKLRVELALNAKEMRCLRKQNEELQGKFEGLHKNGVKDMKRMSTGIGIRSLGELNVKPFEDACRMKHGDDEPKIRAAVLLTTWQYKLMLPSWSPFKTVEADGVTKEVVDDDDPELKQLLVEYGADVCGAVKTALSKMYEHNPGGRYAVPELWNFDEGRKATVKEGIKYLFRKLRKKRKALDPCPEVSSSDCKKAKPNPLQCCPPPASGLRLQQPGVNMLCHIETLVKEVASLTAKYEEIIQQLSKDLAASRAETRDVMRCVGAQPGHLTGPVDEQVFFEWLQAELETTLPSRLAAVQTSGGDASTVETTVRASKASDAAPQSATDPSNEVDA
ncbi:hypothetical protein PR202_gb26459 [Eleusine coracana subsp. coracana]|uniref:Factor of DNA methylation 1-5/IDN2 domain-containing protein n=1 Tax=Eleusine coracana subsp. coracana TaxID=191504 RepID=A0AAV5FP75_ELECO|nr:hypothetical protein PR202_gb26459 [Eleusine coracana subsp. coracana]